MRRKRAKLLIIRHVARKGKKGGIPFFHGIARHRRSTRESSAFLPEVFFQLPGSFLLGISPISPSQSPYVLRSRINESPWSSPFSPILSLGRDVSGSAGPALVLYALSTEHLPRCSHIDAIRRLRLFFFMNYLSWKKKYRSGYENHVGLVCRTPASSNISRSHFDSQKSFLDWPFHIELYKCVKR